jgi:hypothetical protein
VAFLLALLFGPQGGLLRQRTRLAGTSPREI